MLSDYDGVGNALPDECHLIFVKVNRFALCRECFADESGKLGVCAAVSLVQVPARQKNPVRFFTKTNVTR